MTTAAHCSENVKSANLSGPDNYNISHYDNIVPDFIEGELIRLYSHFNSSLFYLKNKFKNEKISTYISYKDNIAVTVLLFTIKGRKAIIINEMLKIAESELLKFSNYIFFNFKNIDIISFSLIQRQPYHLPFFSQWFDRSEDIVIVLPSTPAIYLQNLSAKTRRNIRYQLKKLIRDFPDFGYRTYQCSEINERHIDDLIDLNKNRIAEKNLKYGIDENEKRGLHELAGVCGLVLIATINGKTCGGAINFRLEDSYFGHTIAHDSRFNAYGLGMLCAYLMICENIKLGGKKAHLSWGRYDYKYKLSGEIIEMSRLSVYRSTRSYLSDFFTLLKNRFFTIFKNFKILFLEKEREKSTSSKIISKIIGALRKIKRSLPIP